MMATVTRVIKFEIADQRYSARILLVFFPKCQSRQYFMFVPSTTSLLRNGKYLSEPEVAGVVRSATEKLNLPPN